jgi:hypothetical protein
MRSHSTKAVNSSCNTIWMITPITLKSQLTMSWGNPVTQANKKKENPEECEGLLATYFSFWRISFMWLPLYILGYPLQHCWIPLPFIFDWRKINMLYIVCKTLIDNIRAQILTLCEMWRGESSLHLWMWMQKELLFSMNLFALDLTVTSRICLHMLWYVPIQILVVQRTSEGY